MEQIEKITNKKGMTPRNWIIIGVMISMIFVVSSTWITSWSGKYYMNDTAGNLSSYNYINNLSAQTNILQDSLSSDSGAVTIGFLDFVIKGAYSVLNAVTFIPRLFIGLIRDVGSMYGIPTILIDGVLTLMAVALIFGIVGVIFRKKT